MRVERIESASDPRLGDYRKITDRELVRQRGIFIAEGRFVVRILIESSRLRVRSLLLLEPALSSMEGVLAGLGEEVPVYLVKRSLMNEVIGFKYDQGCLAAGIPEPSPTVEELVSSSRRLLVLEDVTNPDNVGGLFRNAQALGADGLLLGRGCADPFYRKVIRTSMGASLILPFSWLDELPGDARMLSERGFFLVALTPDEGALDLEDFIAKAPLPGSVALLVGNEGAGLSHAARSVADLEVRIPISEGVDSLNVATAAAIALYRICNG